MQTAYTLADRNAVPRATRFYARSDGGWDVYQDGDALPALPPVPGGQVLEVGRPWMFPTVYDTDGSGIGLAANRTDTLGDSSTTTARAELMPPPPQALVPNAIDAGVYWYQDFGLEYTRVNVPGGMVWYDWRWNHKSRAGGFSEYHPDRHPLLGWYHGDDLKVLGWQVKWLLEHGVSFAVCQQRGTNAILDTAGWSTASHTQHWLYQLINNVPAVQDGTFKLALWLPYGAGSSAVGPSNGNWSSATTYTAGQSAINVAYDNRLYTALRTSTNKRPDLNAADWSVNAMPAAWQAFAQFYADNASRIKTISHAGGTYAVVYMHDGESNRALLGNGTYRVWLQELGAAMNALVPAWTGVAVLTNNSPTPSMLDGVAGGGALNYDMALANRALLLRADYNGSAASNGATSYDELISRLGTYATTNAGFGQQRRVLTAPTALTSVAPHPSGFSYHGHSPAAFQRMVSAVRSKIQAGTVFPLVMVANMSEWAESGPGLQPNWKDGFGYLAALKAALS